LKQIRAWEYEQKEGKRYDQGAGGDALTDDSYEEWQKGQGYK